MQSRHDPFLDTTRPLILQNLHLHPSLRVLVLAPHPDDFDAIGITLRTFRDNGNPIDLVVLTSGASGVDDDLGLISRSKEKLPYGNKSKGPAVVFLDCHHPA